MALKIFCNHQSNAGFKSAQSEHGGRWSSLWDLWPSPKSKSESKKTLDFSQNRLCGSGYKQCLHL